MKKSMIIVSAIIGILATVGVIISGIDTKNEEKARKNEKEVYSVVSKLGQLTDDKDVIDNYFEATQNGEEAILKITDDVNGKVKAIAFDGKKYYVNNEEISESYSYFYSVTGTDPNASSEHTCYILSNYVYSYDQFSKSILSSDSKDSLEYHLIGFADN